MAILPHLGGREKGSQDLTCIYAINDPTPKLRLSKSAGGAGGVFEYSVCICVICSLEADKTGLDRRFQRSLSPCAIAASTLMVRKGTSNTTGQLRNYSLLWKRDNGDQKRASGRLQSCLNLSKAFLGDSWIGVGAISETLTKWKHCKAWTLEAQVAQML